LADAARLCLALTLVATLTACGGTSELLGKHTDRHETAAYLSQLSAAQSRLAAAERRIPARPRTPAALSRAIGLLAGAIHRLAGDLRAIRAPEPVSGEHARLVAIVGAYATRLERTARTAATPGGELPATRELIAATSATSRAFSATVAKINSTLARG
jgi:hypothetical protein